MPIPSSQLETWTSYETAAIDSARDTHRHIRDELERDNSRLQDRDITFDTLLQGSYANDTIIRSSSDVDILVRLQRPFSSDKKKLDQEEIDHFYQPGHYTSRSDYSYDDFRTDVVDELEDVYDRDAVDEGNKAIEVESSKLSLNADVLPCQEYRFYREYTSTTEDYIEGIVFWTQHGNKIRNYPEQHMENASRKHQRTSDRYKPTVRMFKNARNRMDDDGILTKDTAPSYFVECLLWNVPNSTIDTADLQDRYEDVVDHLSDDDFDDCRQQHNLLDLFGHGTTKWTISDANDFADGLIELWENW